MSIRALPLAASILSAIVLAGCGGSVKQQRPPRITDEDADAAAMSDGGDLADPEPETVERSEGQEEMSEEEKKAMCCQQCVDGMAKDESGDPPGALNCAKLVEPACVLYFDSNPMTAGEAQSCVEASGGGQEDDAEAETTDEG